MNSDSTASNHDNSSTNNGAPPITGPIGGPLPPAHTPLKPHLPPPEVSAVRDEEPLPAATSHQMAGDDHPTASAASAVAESENLSNGQPKVSALPEQASSIKDEASEIITQPPSHESDARNLNGSGIAGTSESQISSSVAAPISQEAQLSSLVEEKKEPSIISAPGTQNPYNESEEKSIHVDAPVPVPQDSLEKMESLKEEPEKVPTQEPQPVPTANAEVVKEEDVEMKDVHTNGNTTIPPVSETQTTPTAIPAEASKLEAADRRSSTAAPEDGASLPALAEADATDLTAAQIRACQNAIKGLKSRNDAQLFLAPVDPVAAGVPHYFDFIKTPMDLGTVDYKLALTAAAQKGGNKHTEKTKQGIKAGLNPLTDVYKTLEDFEKDVRLIFSNCVLFNGPDHPLSLTAKTLDGVFDKQLKSIVSTNADDNGAEASAAALAAARRPSEGVAAARPKRDIHPPPPKDLPYADRPQSASGSLVKRKKSRGKMSAREVAFYDKLDKDQIKYALQAVDEFHQEPAAQYAWVFFEKPGMDLEFSQAYYATIKNPISLKEIRERIVTGEYEDIDGPANDMKLLLDNCFLFNAKGTDVYVMGEKLKSAWETKLAKMPRPNPPVVDDDDDEDEDADEDYDDEDVETRILEIREQIASLQKELDRLTGRAKGGGKSKGGSKKRRPSESAGGSAKKAPAAKKAKSSNSGEPRKSGGGGSGGGSSKKASAGSGGGGKREEEVREVTYEQKEELAAKITQLPDDRLDGALKIIAEDKPPNANDDEEIELDIDDLSPSTLYKLYRYVVRPKGKKVTTSKLSSSDGRKRGTGGVKRKNLDEEEEAARIARLQAQLNQFDQAETTPAPKSATVAAGHDDLVASESSSGEEDYESESDFE